MILSLHKITYLLWKLTDVPEFLMDFLGSNDGVQAKIVIITSEIVVKASELMFPNFSFFRKLELNGQFYLHIQLELF
jgi:hypothetical protein